MKKTPYLVLLITLAVGLVACGKAAVKYDADRAASDAGVTLRQIYFDGAFDDAYASLDPSFRSISTVDDLKSIVTKETDMLGPLSELRAEAYLPVKGQTGLILFFQGIHQKGTAYLRLDMLGDVNGYKVGSLSVGGAPFAEATGSGAVQYKDPLVITP